MSSYMQKLSLFIYMLVLANISYSQQDFSLKNIVPPSPEASAFVKYGTYPVGSYTGKPDISIPIYEIKTNNLSVPITLSYDATGIRVNNSAGWVGLNWSLSAGGMVSQMVVGEPDKLNTDFEAVPPRASEIVNNSTYFDYLKGLADHANGWPLYPDGEPDKFFYTLPNGSGGSFVLDRNRNIMQIPKTSRKISFNGVVVTIIDESGTTYIFNVYENTETYASGYKGSSPVPPGSGGSTYKNQKTGYYLSEIISNDGLEHIYFTYENEYSTAKDDSYTEYLGDHWETTGEAGGWTFSSQHFHEYLWTGVRRIISIPRLKTITFTNGKIEFTRVANRLDDEITSSRLDEITVFHKSSATTYAKLKSFKFIQGYYYSSGSYAPYTGFPHEAMDRYRLKLDELKLKDASGNELSSYKFSYNNTELPPKTSCSQDWWGYYNGMLGNTTSVPTTSVPVGGGANVTIGNADRTAVESYMKAGVLEKITYPTGGYTVFETECHKMYSPTSISSQNYQSVALGQSTNNLTTQTFTVPSNVTVGGGSGVINITISPYGYSDPVPFVKIKNLTTGQEQVINSSDLNQWFSYSLPYNFFSGESFQLTTSCYINRPNATAVISASFYTTVPVPELIPVGGLRIKSIKNYSSNNVLANEENYRYGPNENGGGVFAGLSGNAYNYYRVLQTYWTYTYGCFITPGNRNVFLGGPLFEQSLIQGSPVVYTDVVKYLGNSTNNVGKTAYYYGFQAIETHPLPSNHLQANNQGIITINNSWKQGQLLRQEEYKNNNGTYTLAASTENSYNIFYTDTTYGLFAQTKFDRNVLSPQCLVPYFSDFAWAEYPVYTGYVQLAQTIKKEYDPNASGYLQTTISHTYDATRKDIEIKTASVNSKGETIESEKKFPFHKSSLLTSITPAESTALDDMVTKNMLFPVEEIQRNNNTQMLLKKTSYEYINSSTIAPVNIKYQVKSNPIETRLQFTKYDANGNLVEQKKANDGITSYLWGYDGTVPVVQVVGADYNTINAMISPSVLSDPNPDPATLRTQLNNIRTGLAGTSALVTTYTYKPLVGKTSETDANGKTIYYEYDSFNRLRLIRDKDNNIIKRICYNYFGQVEECNVGLFGNDPQSGSFVRNNCDPGYSGSSVTYTVPANTYTASTLAAANLLAMNDVAANGQAYANANGTCTFGTVYWNTSMFQFFTKNDCPPGTTPGTKKYIVPANTYSSTVSQAAAQALAQADIDANGQNYANANATCTPSACNPANCSGEAYKCINNVCELGYRVNTNSIYHPETNNWECIYHYEFSDGSWSPDYSSFGSSPCYNN